MNKERRGKDVKHEMGTGLNDYQESLNTQRITFTRASNINKTITQFDFKKLHAQCACDQGLTCFTFVSNEKKLKFNSNPPSYLIQLLFLKRTVSGTTSWRKFISYQLKDLYLPHNEGTIGLHHDFLFWIDMVLLSCFNDVMFLKSFQGKCFLFIGDLNLTMTKWKGYTPNYDRVYLYCCYLDIMLSLLRLSYTNLMID